MRTDPVKGLEIRQSPALESSAQRAVEHLERSSAGEHSLSGHEANRFFYNDRGRRFFDLSGLSGMDHEGDGRSVVLWDYDRDGWTDVATVNANAPQLVCYRNGLQEEAVASWVALRAVGGNWTPAPVPGLACRDGYGAMARIEAGGRVLVREWRCGEGFAAQNSRTLLVGLGSARQADRVTVTWPSGLRQEMGPVAAGRLVTVYEDPRQAPDGAVFVEEEYRRGGAGE
ncbi:MAG TPA: ASPIC/UnbV domain-containing protein [Verrucomicrobiales bacterium]|nr:ASPIC/UnbV domain-containing protein [Verrucomicrobiales bacterium]